MPSTKNKNKKEEQEPRVELAETKREDDDKDDENNPTTDETKKRRRKRKRKRNKSDDNDKDDKKDSQPPNTVSDNNDPSLTVDEQRAAECDRTVFVEGIPYDATEQNVRDFFHQAEIADIVDCRLPVWQDTGRLRGYGHVVFATVESHQKAIGELNGKYLKNRFLSIQAAKRPRDVVQGEGTSSSEPSKTVLLNNLSYDATEDDIQVVLEQFGTIAEGGVRVVRNSVNQRSKGFAYVEFEDIAAATKVMQTRIVILQRPCRVDYDHGRIRGSFRTATGSLWQKEHGVPSNYGKRQRHSRESQE